MQQPGAPNQKKLTRKFFQPKQKISYTFPEKNNFTNRKIVSVRLKEPITQPSQKFLKLIWKKLISYNYWKKNSFSYLSYLF